MQPPPVPLAAEARISDVATRLADEGRLALPMVDVDGRLIGVVDANAIERALERGEDDSALGLAESIAALRPEDDLSLAIEAITEGDREGLPIIDESRGLLGWVEHRDLLRAYATKGRRPVDPSPEGLVRQRGL